MLSRKPQTLFLILGLLSVFALLRLGTILTAVERISYPDELAAGTMAKEVLEGLKFPLFYYQPDYYSAEPTAALPFTLASFKLFGPTLFALKFSRLLQALLFIGAACFFIARHFGKASALILLALFAFLPPTPVQMLFLPVTAHMEALLWTLFTLIAFAEYISGKNRTLVMLAVFGFLSGFSFWIFPQTIILTSACWIVWFFESRAEVLSRRGLAYFLFFLLGAAPWGVSNLQNHYRDFIFLQESTVFSFPLHEIPGLVFQKIFRYVFWTFFSMFSTHAVFSVHPTVYSYTYGVSLFIIHIGLIRAWIANPRRFSEKPVLSVLCLVPVLFGLSFFTSRFDAAHKLYVFDLRYLTPLAFFSLLATSIALDRHHNWKAGLTWLLILGALGQEPMLFKDKHGLAFETKGYSYVTLGNRLTDTFPFEKHRDDYPVMASLFSKDDGFYFLLGALQLDFGLNELEDGGPDDWEIPKDQPAAVQRLYAERLGIAIASRQRSREEVLQRLSGTTPELQAGILRGYFASQDEPTLKSWLTTETPAEHRALACRRLGMLLDPYGPEFIQTKDDFCGGVSESFYHGAGDSLICEDCLYLPAFQEFLRTFPERLPRNLRAEADAVSWSLGWNVRKALPEDRVRALHALRKLPSIYWPSAAQGFEACEKLYELPA
jgi:hypothetical protein